jgi:membrane metallo-endopeptidase-like protein 1
MNIIIIFFIISFQGEIEDWWEPQTEASFKERAQCIIDQYGNYTDPQVQINLNGINNQGENIADNGGVKQAYKAYRK